MSLQEKILKGLLRTEAKPCPEETRRDWEESEKRDREYVNKPKDK